MRNNTLVLVAYGVIGNQTFGPYTQKDLDERDASSTTYADRIICIEDGQDVFAEMQRYSKESEEPMHHCVTCGEETEGMTGCAYVCEDCFEHGEY